MKLSLSFSSNKSFSVRIYLSILRKISFLNFLQLFIRNINVVGFAFFSFVKKSTIFFFKSLGISCSLNLINILFTIFISNKFCNSIKKSLMLLLLFLCIKYINLALSSIKLGQPFTE